MSHRKRAAKPLIARRAFQRAINVFCFSSNLSHFLFILEEIARFFARNNRAVRVFIANFLLSSIFFRAPLLLLQSSLHLKAFGEYGTPDLLCIHTVLVLSDS